MLRALPLTLLALGSACATSGSVLERPAGGFYRIPGRAPDPMPFSAEEGALAYALEPGGGVGYAVEAAITNGEVRVAVVLSNAGPAPLAYDLRRLALTGAGGQPLELAGLQEDPSRRPSAADRARDDYRAGVRQVLRGERIVVTRRYRVAAADAEGGAGSLAALELEDVVGADGQAVPVKLHLERAR